MGESFWSEIIDYTPLAIGRVRNHLYAPMNVCEDIVSDAILDTAQFIISGKFNKKCQVATLFYRIVNRRAVDFIRLETKLRRKGVGVIVEFDCYYVDDFAVNGEERRVVVAIAIRIRSSDKREKRIISEWVVTERNIGLLWFRVTDFIQESRKGFFIVEAKVEYPIESGNISEVKSKLYVY